MADTAAAALAKVRVPPHVPGQYEFACRVTGTVDVEDADSAKKTVVYYAYEVVVTRLGKCHRFPSDAATSSLFQKRWSEIDAFDADWRRTIGVQPEDHAKNPLHDEIGLKTSEKWSAPLRSSQAIKEKRTALLEKYIGECMSEPLLHRPLAKFLGVPFHILSPPTPEELRASSESDVSAAPRPSSVEAPLSYTKRKIKPKPKKAEPEPDEEMEEEVAAVPTQTEAASSSPSAASVAASAPGASAAAHSSTVAFSADHGPAGPASVRVPTQYKSDGHTPNPKWHGPSLAEWARLDVGVDLLKLPHGTGLFDRPKVRRFRLLPFDSPDAQAKLKEAKQTKRGKMYEFISGQSFLLTWSSSKSDVLDTFFVLGDVDIAWAATFDQSAPESHFHLHKAYQSAEQAALSFTVRYRDGLAMKTVDLIAARKDEFDLWRKALTYVRWKETAVCTAEPPPLRERVAAAAAAAAAAALPSTPKHI